VKRNGGLYIKYKCHIENGIFAVIHMWWGVENARKKRPASSSYDMLTGTFIA
jgi:hypothetical protein